MNSYVLAESIITPQKSEKQISVYLESWISKVKLNKIQKKNENLNFIVGVV
jgi:hypothetical protein